MQSITVTQSFIVIKIKKKKSQRETEDASWQIEYPVLLIGSSFIAIKTGPLLIMQACASSIEVVKELLSAYFTESSLWLRGLSDQHFFLWNQDSQKAEVLMHMFRVNPVFRCFGLSDSVKKLLSVGK